MTLYVKHCVIFQYKFSCIVVKLLCLITRWRRSSDVKRVHFSEEWNEFHHLLIMESLGGGKAVVIIILASRGNTNQSFCFSLNLILLPHLYITFLTKSDQTWWVRFIAQHAAIVYFWTLIILWMISPSLGYKFSEMLETHAVETYSQFVEENEQLLQELPPPLEAVEYYCLGADDPLFSDYQTSSRSGDGEVGAIISIALKLILLEFLL